MGNDAKVADIFHGVAKIGFPRRISEGTEWGRKEC
jgi:hypothetical protein